MSLNGDLGVPGSMVKPPAPRQAPTAPQKSASPVKAMISPRLSGKREETVCEITLHTGEIALDFLNEKLRDRNANDCALVTLLKIKNRKRASEPVPVR